MLIKLSWFTSSLFVSSLLYASNIPAQNATGVMLQNMNNATQTLNYQLVFINVNKLGIESLQYRHSVQKNTVLAQLLQMDGSRREIVQRGNEVSFFEAGLEPFTLSGDHIVDAMPTVVFSDFQRLSHYYNFIPVGRARIADRACEVVRIVAQDGLRYSYVVWLDETTNLLLRADLLDHDGNTLEQFRVIRLVVGLEVLTQMAFLEKMDLPPVLPMAETEKRDIKWQVNWLPQGFKEISCNRRTLPGIAQQVESCFFSDGLFSFSINMSLNNDRNSEQVLRQGRRTVHTKIRNNQEIVVVGELPPTTAQRIADSVTWRTTP